MTTYAGAFSPDGRRIATAQQDGTVCLWDASSGDRTRVLSHHPGAVLDVAFSPDGTLLASSGGDGDVAFWDATSGDLLDVLHPADNVSGLAWSPDGQTTVVADGDEAVVFDVSLESRDSSALAAVLARIPFRLDGGRLVRIER